MRIEICDKCRTKQAVGRFAIFFRKLGGSDTIFVRHIKNRAYCKECAEELMTEISEKYGDSDAKDKRTGDVPIAATEFLSRHDK